MSDAERSRAVAFMRALETACSSRIEPFEGGRALFHEDFPFVRDLNFLRVEAAGPEITAPGLAAEAERVQGAAGLVHRKVAIDDEALGERLAPGFQQLDWQTDRLLIMARHRSPARRRAPGIVREIDLEEIKRARELTLEDEGGHSEEVKAQLRDMVEVVARAGKARFFGAEAGGEYVSVCELYAGSGNAQIEAVMTLTDYRGQGLGTAVVLAALEAAEAMGAELVFLTADADDWPRELYAKLGFDTIGVIYDFTLIDATSPTRRSSH
jgi:ribosomal protein S18 acetylase RimI-like enzyme